MSKNFKGNAIALAAMCMWGLSGQSYAALRTYLSPIEIIVVGMLLSFAVLNVVCLPRLKLKKKTNELWFILAGALGVAGYFYFNYATLANTSAESYSVILAFVPITCSIASNILLKNEKSTAAFFSGFGFAALGIFLINFFKLGTFYVSLSGVLYGLVAAVCLGSFYAVLKRLTNIGGSAVQITRRVFFWGILMLIPLCFFMDFEIASYAYLLDIRLILHTLFVCIAVPSVCYVGTTYAVRQLGTSRTSVYLYAAPVVSILMYTFINGTAVTAHVLLGVVLTMVGLTISVNR